MVWSLFLQRWQTRNVMFDVDPLAFFFFLSLIGLLLSLNASVGWVCELSSLSLSFNLPQEVWDGSGLPPSFTTTTPPDKQANSGMYVAFTKKVFMVMEFPLLPSKPRPSCLAHNVVTTGHEMPCLLFPSPSLSYPIWLKRLEPMPLVCFSKSPVFSREMSTKGEFTKVVSVMVLVEVVEGEHQISTTAYHVELIIAYYPICHLDH